MNCISSCNFGIWTTARVPNVSSASSVKYPSPKYARILPEESSVLTRPKLIGPAALRPPTEPSRDVYFARRRPHLLRHHAHDGAYINPIILLHGTPALNRGRGNAERGHPVVDDDCKFRHLVQRLNGSG